MDHFLMIGCNHVVTIPLGGDLETSVSARALGHGTAAPPKVALPNVPLPLLHTAGPTLVPVSVLTSAVRKQHTDLLLRRQRAR